MPKQKKHDEEEGVEEPLATPPEATIPGVPAVVTPEIYKWAEENDPHFGFKKPAYDALLSAHKAGATPEEAEEQLAEALDGDGDGEGDGGTPAGDEEKAEGHHSAHHAVQGGNE